MTGTDFLLALYDLMPSRAELEADGLSPEGIEDIQSSFRAIPRQLSGLVPGSELEKMILDYDCSKVEVSWIRFLEKPVLHPHGIQVADFEAEMIVVSPAGTVVMYDHEDPDFAVEECAADSERFLDALITFLTILRNKSKWKGRYDSAVALCAEKAGGRNYARFFNVLCGFLA